ncbi:conserved Plasmodium protein, unknown function [Plasmodium berghei]|uniref:Uncharacterized protein n=2 Tax=Plasmodium berghei TaxID=5821 RepID=A0A509AP48_PLABA|nr:conserved Plasmodium protein, unknown function [Plasmodium berghei ANKA]CXI63441.1 conserved Plasmodium protein, unknown function [Plasmodium berghei]SCM23795.1 conserved Plasmodium protein, unknown function [Plasmodium berghei]SCN26778.1 conserved Plasmodium protein, unknown function [Plasmodium berghei]SCO61116.1 conserved Plasmodium protein, unknown function [Plasmodium berghei]SCO63197.1 conserved Plasmodium protein, unknown function [Plasmodium berghei]|eukprot:XP_034422395.1 conserved Plasmodium protein, unknown function [Plasmodium berghei ANKA]
MKKKIILNSVRNIEKRFFFSKHKTEQVNKIVYDYFYTDIKIYNVIDVPDIKKLMFRGENNTANIPTVTSHNVNDDIFSNNEDGTRPINIGTKLIENNMNDNINNDIFNEQLKHVINNYLCNYVTSSKYFNHLCVFYIYNNEKEKFYELMKNFTNYCFGYEDLFILFYLICKINYKNKDIIRYMLKVFENYYYKIDNTFSYNISNLLFYPYDNLYTAINNLPLFYKIKLINLDKYYFEKINKMKGSSMEKLLDFSQENSTVDKLEKRSNINEESKNSYDIDKNENPEFSENSENLIFNKIDESTPGNVLENLQEVDMEAYEKRISKDSIKFINLNIKKEKKNIKTKEIKYEGLKLKSSLITQIKTQIERKEINPFEAKEILSIFINDNKLAEKNYYMMDFINSIVNYFIGNNKDILHNNLLIFLVFLDNIKYYSNKKINNKIEELLQKYIPSMENINEKYVDDFVNEQVIMSSYTNGQNDTILNENRSILNLLYNQEYTYNFSLYDENKFYENKSQHIMNKILKNYFFLICYILNLPLKYHILKSYINLFGILLDIFKGHRNIYYSFDICDISLICTFFFKKKIIDDKIVNKLFNILNYKIDELLLNTSNHDISSNSNMSNNEKLEPFTKKNECPLPLNDIVIFLYFINFYNLKYDKLCKQLIMICFNKYHHLNDTQKLIFFNSIEVMKKKNIMSDLKYILDYFMYEKNMEFFLNKNKNIQKESLGFLFAN